MRYEVGRFAPVCRLRTGFFWILKAFLYHESEKLSKAA